MTVSTEPQTAFDRLPRITLGVWPTPLERLPKMSDELGVELWVKRDDLTSLALGGNKVRKLEFLLGHALSAGADVIITTGGTQSNHARLTAAACCRLGIECRLVLDRGRHPENGNLLLDELFEAKVTLVEEPDPAVAAAGMEALAQTLRSEGRNPFVIPRGGSIPQGAVGYANMVGELADQLAEVGLRPDCLYVGTGSRGTHSGIMAGRAHFGQTWPVQGISVSHPQLVQETNVLSLSNETLTWMESEARVEADSVSVDASFAGPAYGVPTPETWEAIRLLARLEGMVVDPVYTGKALAGLIAHARSGRLAPNSTVIFVHTGGSPALFAYAAEAPWV